MPLSKLTRRQLPMVSAILQFILGIHLGKSAPLSYLFWLILTLTLISMLILLSREVFHWSQRGPVISLAVISLGAFHFSSSHHINSVINPPDQFDGVKGMYKVYVDKIDSTKKFGNIYGSMLEFKPSTADLAYEVFNNHIIVKIPKEEMNFKFQSGDIISFEKTLYSLTAKQKKNDYYTFLLNQGVRYIVYLKSAEVSLISKRRFELSKWIRRDVREMGLNFLDKHLHAQTIPILKALIFGYKKELDLATKTKFVKSGMIHVLTVSGLHVGIVAFIFFSIVRIIFYRNHKYSLINVCTIIAMLLFYAELSGGAPPVYRATLMTSLFLISKSFSVMTNSLNLLAVSALVLLLIDPNLLYSISFQMSYCAVGGILLVYPIFSYHFLPQQYVLNKVFSIIFLGLSAQLFIAPITIFHFGTSSVISPISSVFAIPCSFFLISAFIVLVTIGWMHPFISDLLVYFIDKCTSVFLFSAEYFSNAPINQITSLSLNPTEVIVILSSLILLAVSFHNRKTILAFYGLIGLTLQALYHIFSLIEIHALSPSS